MPTSGSSQGNEHHHQFVSPRVSSSQSTMAMSSLIPSEPSSEWAADSSRMTMHNRSVSEPDIGRTPRQVDSSKDTSSSNTGSHASGTGGISRFRCFGFGSQLLQKTVGLVLKPRQGRQAKLGDSNKFYYDEKLERWVEEGAELPASEPPLAPPPTAPAFLNGAPDYNVKSVLKSESPICNNGFPEMKSPTSSDNGAGIPPLPPTSNQFSARGHMGVHSRYVDTFNKGGGNPTNLFQLPSVPSIKPATAGNAKFFVPARCPLLKRQGTVLPMSKKLQVIARVIQFLLLMDRPIFLHQHRALCLSKDLQAWTTSPIKELLLALYQLTPGKLHHGVAAFLMLFPQINLK
ncbi:protein transport protein SEC16B homolog [Solanum tuberosum]|uniref:protein transport protein SEC16B homolog n=1 Tax=Solanum tuberosum TaxID=4113 RepID=UPI00073A5238|nr:PREDICTED: protein transport protein SEC16B homolog [Solanum tuberosum]XP_015167748.1 PREDICTED: protein transport protein SEC16B homolog [Solanum tuberosum]